MEYFQYLEKINNKLRRHFDIERDFLYKDIKIDLFAKYFLRNEKYFATKKVSIYAFENNEYCFIKYFDQLNDEKIQNFIEYLKFAVDDFITPNSEHMSSVITGVIVTDKEFDRDITNVVEKFKFHKSFAFGFKGWVDIRLILVNLGNNEIIINKKGKEVKEVYQP